MQSHTKKWKKNWKEKSNFFPLNVCQLLCMQTTDVCVCLIACVICIHIICLFLCLPLFVSLSVYLYVPALISAVSMSVSLSRSVLIRSIFLKNAHFLSTSKFMNSKIFILKCQQFIALSDNLKNATSKNEKINLFYCLNHFITIFFHFYCEKGNCSGGRVVQVTHCI